MFDKNSMRYIKLYTKYIDPDQIYIIFRAFYQSHLGQAIRCCINDKCTGNVMSNLRPRKKYSDFTRGAKKFDHNIK